MDKIITYTYGDNDSEVLKLVHPGSMTKTADYSEDLIHFIKALKPANEKTYALVNAMGAGEYYGANKNGDYFPDKALAEYHKTFEAMARVYRHHINRDPQKSMGKIVFSHYHPKMKRVELILELDNSKSRDILDKLEGGHLPAVSMGCRVPYDVCSICGNKAKTVAVYCNHLKTSMGKILADGRRVYAINTMPKFFDLSVVTIPADRTASFLSKVACDKSPDKLKPTVLESGEKWAEVMTKEAQLTAEADIKKKIVAKVDAVIQGEKDKHRLLEPVRLKEEQLQKLSEYPFKDVLSTFMGLQFLPHRADFQKLALLANGMNEQAKFLEKTGTVFEVTPDTEVIDLDDVSLDKFNKNIAEIISDNLPVLAATKQAAVTRGLLKLAEMGDTTYNPKTERSLLGKTFFSHTDEPDLTSHKNPVLPLGILATLYYSYSKMIPDANQGMFKKFLAKNPWLLPVMVGAGTVGTLKAQDWAFRRLRNDMKKTAAYPAAAMVSIPTSYYFSALADEKARRGKPIGKKENFVRKHPALVAFLATLGLGRAGVKVRKLIKRSSFHRDSSAEKKVAQMVYQLDKTSLDNLYNDLVN